MPRIANLSSQQLITSQMLQTQQRLFEAQISVTSEQKSQVYSGISEQSQRLISMENNVTQIDKFLSGNQTIDTRLELAEEITENVTDDIQEFKKWIIGLPTDDSLTQDQIRDTQDWAFRLMKDIEARLNEDVDGQYLFAGSNRDSKPVDLGLTDLSTFQNTYDGQSVTYPSTRSAHLANFEINQNTAGATNWVTFDATTARVTSSAGTNEFTNLAVGTKVTLTNAGVNNGTYTVSAVDSGGDWFEVNEVELTDETTLATVTTDASNDTAATLTLEDGSTITSTAYGQLNFDGTANTMTANTKDAFQDLKRGDIIKVTGHGVLADGTYKITSEATDSSNYRTVGIEPAATLTTETGTELKFSDFGALTFNQAGDSITAGTAGSLTTFQVGQEITVKGTLNNDGTYVVATNPAGTALTITPKKITTAAVATTATIKADDYYKGDQLSQNYRISKNRTVDINLTAVDPGFEKAIRALGILAQGAQDTAGGLKENRSRLDDALYLLNDAISHPQAGTPPYGTEANGSIETMQFELGFVRKRISDQNTRHTDFKFYMQQNIDNIEKVDLTEAITDLQREAQALEASYQVFARFQELSLNKYI